MIIPKPIVVFALALALTAAWSAAADAQQPSRTQRGSVKVQPRFFNPFDVSRTRLTMDRFGNFSISDAANFPFAARTSSSSALPTEARVPASVIAPAGVGAASATTGPEDSGSADAVAQDAVTVEEDSEAFMGGAGSAVRPPYRPPRRSPFRPPPRPPFFPL